jgi:hypothetical protein
MVGQRDADQHGRLVIDTLGSVRFFHLGVMLLIGGTAIGRRGRNTRRGRTASSSILSFPRPTSYTTGPSGSEVFRTGRFIFSVFFLFGGIWGGIFPPFFEMVAGKQKKS